MNFPRINKPKAFTLIELLAVIAIIAILATLGVVGSKKAMASADNVRCLSNLRQIGAAISLYGGDNQGALPGQCDNSIRTTYRINNGDLGAFIAPYLGLLAADTVTRDATSLMCPAWKNKMKAADGKCYWSPFRLKGFYNPDNPSGYFSPFGKGQPDGKPLRMQTILSIPGFAASRQWMIQDFDMVNGSGLEMPGQSSTPVHGSVRNVIFFDFHAESVPVSTVLN